MKSRLGRLLLAAVIVSASRTPGFAQGSSQSISGIVVDSAGAVIPGAAVLVRSHATGETFETASNEAGAFSIPAIAAGTYTVTVTLQGFKTAVISDVRVLTATPASVKATLELGTLAESVEVRAGTELVQTQSTAVTSTFGVEQISELPLSSRNALYFAAMLPGVETVYGSNVGARQSSFSGLPQNTINITLDGVTTGNLLQSGDGFFSMVTPRLDAVEEITVTGAAGGATGGPGAVQIAFTTRSGTNTFTNSIYHYFRHPALNSNYYFNRINGLDRNEVIVHQYGGRSGGPIVIPGLVNGRNRAFYFVNVEHLHQPGEATRTRTILNPAAERGVFTYLATAGGVQQARTVNLLALAAANGHTSTPDPTIAAMLAKIRAATATTGTVSTPAGSTNTESYVFQAASRGNQYAPTTRIDVNLTDGHRLTGTYYWQRFLSKPDLLNNAEAVFPGFAAESFQTSYRTTGSIALRSTLGASLVNEVRSGWQWSPNDFFGNVTASMFEDQAGFRFDFPLVTDPSVNNHNNPAPRNTVNWNIDDTLSWLKGAHSVTLGGSFLQVTHNQNEWNVVPTITIGIDTNGNDPANAMFTTANFPNASTANLNQARDIYAILTGRVTAVGGTARLDADSREYVYLGNLFQRSRLNSFALFGQDSWRWTPRLTVNYGLRWDLQLPVVPLTPTWSTASLEDLCGVSGIGSGPGGRECNLFQPGRLPPDAQAVPTYDAFSPGSRGFDTDWNNVAPNIGVAWRPGVERGFMRTLLGDPDQATLRAAYSLNYGLERLDRFINIYGSNPGGSITATRNYTTGYPLGTGPVLFRDRARLGPPGFPTGPEYPLRPTASTDDVNIFDADVQTPFVQSYSVGLQRSLGTDTAIEVRYVGNRNHHTWTTENWNELVLFENGFFDEFRRAQANLAAHVAQGCGGTANPCSFAYRGPGTGTSPLPVYLAYFQGLARERAGDAAAYTSANFRNSAWTGQLGYHEPDVEDAANDLHANLMFRGNALRAGIPANYFVMNPAVDDADIIKSLAGTRYHSGQVEVRRRLAKGLLLNGSYTYAFKRESSLQTLRLDRFYLNGTDVPHSFKVNWLYEVPVGRGRRFGANMHPVLTAILGDWAYSGTGRLQQQQFSTSDGQLFGMTLDELQDAFKIRTERSADGTITVFSFPEDIVLNTRRAFATDPTSATGYGSEGPPTGRYIGPASSRDCVAVYAGDCGAPRQIILGAPLFSRWDMRLNKRFPMGRKAHAELIVEVQNVFDSPNFNHQFDPTPDNPLTSADTFRVRTAYTDINTTYDPGGRLGQLAWRFSW